MDVLTVERLLCLFCFLGYFLGLFVRRLCFDILVGTELGFREARPSDPFVEKRGGIALSMDISRGLKCVYCFFFSMACATSRAKRYQETVLLTHQV